MIAFSVISGCAGIAQPEWSHVWVPLVQQSAQVGEPTILRVSIALPRGKSATVSTPTGELIGSIQPYLGSGKRTYLFVVSPAVASQSLRRILVSANVTGLDAGSLEATLIVPLQ
jgi:hypothetical protein